MTKPQSPENVTDIPEFIAFIEAHKPPEAISIRHERVTRTIWRSVAGLIELSTTDYATTLTIQEVTPAHFEETDGDYASLGKIGRAIAPEYTEDELPKLSLIAVPDSPLPANQEVECVVTFPSGRLVEELYAANKKPRYSDTGQYIAPTMATKVLLALGVFEVETFKNDPTDPDHSDRE